MKSILKQVFSQAHPKEKKKLATQAHLLEAWNTSFHIDCLLRFSELIWSHIEIQYAYPYMIITHKNLHPIPQKRQFWDKH
jgi:hypothetical protein